MNHLLTMTSLDDGYRALVIGASGALGTAFCEHLRQDPRCAGVRALGRHTVPELDLERPETIASADRVLVVHGGKIAQDLRPTPVSQPAPAS